MGIGSSSPCSMENICVWLIDGINSDNRLKSVIIPLAKVLLRILHATSYYEKSGDPKSEEQWDIEQLHDVPQQVYE